MTDQSSPPLDSEADRLLLRGLILPIFAGHYCAALDRSMPPALRQAAKDQAVAIHRAASRFGLTGKRGAP
jgi:hypothetical protein